MAGLESRAESRSEPGTKPATTNEKASGQMRDASFGIVVAVVVAALVWIGLIGLYLFLFR